VIKSHKLIDNDQTMVKAKQTWTIIDHNELSNTLLHTKTEGEPVVNIVSSRSDHPLRFL
jgi:hypothetical protein